MDLRNEKDLRGAEGAVAGDPYATGSSFANPGTNPLDRVATANDDNDDDDLSDDSSDTAGNNDNGLMGDGDRSELRRIATDLSRRRSSVAAPANLTRTLTAIDENDPALDPDHRDFTLEKWVKAFVKRFQEKGISRKGTGVAFRNLDVYGSGSALQIQDTVGSFLTAPLRLGNYLSFGKKEPKQILHRFDGLLRQGEMLIVLGRPGSGCSTLLKSLTGELHGLKVGENSSVYYKGIPQKQMQKEFRGEAVYNQEVRSTSTQHVLFRRNH